MERSVIFWYFHSIILWFSPTRVYLWFRQVIALRFFILVLMDFWCLFWSEISNFQRELFQYFKNWWFLASLLNLFLITFQYDYKRLGFPRTKMMFSVKIDSFNTPHLLEGSQLWFGLTFYFGWTWFLLSWKAGREKWKLKISYRVIHFKL